MIGRRLLHYELCRLTTKCDDYRMRWQGELVTIHVATKASAPMDALSDFANVTPKRILIYADGLEFHSAIRQRIHDTRQSNQLQTEGWQVLRFLGPHVQRNPADCVTQLQNALGLRQP
jgi:very-short-patch-repair endonuclease